MNDDSLELTKLRSNFYYLNYRRMVSALLLLLIINLALTGVIFYHIANQPDPSYHATSQSGNITQIYALSDPIMTPQDVLQWAGNLATTIYTYNFVNYNDVIQQLEKYFTPEGFENFKNTFQDAKALEPIITKKIVVSSSINGLPIILGHSVSKGHYVWKVRIPLLITYQSPVETTQQPIELTMFVTRVSTRDIAIAKLEAVNKPVITKPQS